MQPGDSVVWYIGKRSVRRKGGVVVGIDGEVASVRDESVTRPVVREVALSELMLEEQDAGLFVAWAARNS